MRHFLYCVIANFCIFTNISLASDLDPIKITTWNMEWFAGHGYPQMQQSIRTEQDLAIMAEMFISISPDVFAFQEVDSKQAIRKIVGEEYALFFSERSLDENNMHQFNGINQYTGLAINKNWIVSNQMDLNLNEDPYHKLRFATYIIAQPPNTNAMRIHILSIHLKAGCPAKYKSNRSCIQLKEQTQNIAHWINKRTTKGQAYLVLGDFNHDIVYKNDWMWAMLSEASEHSIELASINTSADCLVKSRDGNSVFKYRSLIDHIISSNSLIFEKVKQEVFDEKTVINHNLSDHCPLTAQMFIK